MRDGPDGPSHPAVVGDGEHEGAVDDEAEGYDSEHVRAEGLVLDGLQRGAEAAGLARVRVVGGQQEESPGDGDSDGAG